MGLHVDKWSSTMEKDLQGHYKEKMQSLIVESNKVRAFTVG